MPSPPKIFRDTHEHQDEPFTDFKYLQASKLQMPNIHNINRQLF